MAFLPLGKVFADGVLLSSCLSVRLSVCPSVQREKSLSPPLALAESIRVFDISVVLDIVYNLTEPEFSIWGQGHGQGRLKVKS